MFYSVHSWKFNGSLWIGHFHLFSKRSMSDALKWTDSWNRTGNGKCSNHRDRIHNFGDQQLER